MSRRPGLRLPWEKDPNDKEANYRRPIPDHEKIRLLAKGASVVAAFFFITNTTKDRSDVGAEFLIGVGGPLLLAGVLDLIWTLRGQLEHVFIESRSLQLASHSLVATIGVAMLGAGLVAKLT